jgi:glycosyltransferase involved in cell wall biosynthesis
MKIVIVSSYNIGNETGTAKISERLSDHFSKNHQMLYVCLGKKFKLQQIGKNLDYLKIPAVEIGGLWIPKITPKIKNKVFEHLSQFQPDVIHAQNVVFTGLLTLLWAKQNDIPFVVTFHSLPSEGIRYVFPKLKKDKVISTIDYKLSSGYVKRLLKNVDMVVALNKSVNKSISKLNSSTPTTIIRNGLELAPFSNLAVNTNKKNVNFIFLGTYMGRKNQEFLVKTFKYLPKNYKLNLYGNLKSGQFYVKKLKKIIKKGIITNVKINGFISQRKVYKALEKANYFVSASLKEVQSLVIIEALAAGLPVIGLKNETINELINRKNGLKLPQKTTPKAFAQQLQIFVEKTNNNYTVISENCRRSVKQFDISLVTHDLINAYKRVIEITAIPKTKKKGRLQAQLKALIPSQVKDIFDEKVAEKLEKSKPSYLKILLSITFFFSLIVSFIAFIASLVRRRKKTI